jgi:hypothetical protein
LLAIKNKEKIGVIGGTSLMETKQEFFDFENKISRPFFDKFYSAKGYEVKRITGIKNKDYDCEVKIGEVWYKVEEKYRSREIHDCLIETMQDTETSAIGWLYYCKADYILYGGGNKIYCIDFPQLKKFLEKYKDKFNTKISKKGWGITENIVIDWPTLKINKIAKQIL